MCNLRHFLWSGLLAAMLELPALAGNVTLGWDADPDANVAGYNVFYWIKGGNFTNEVSLGNATSVTISNLVAGTTYYFAAATYDATGLQSPISSAIAFTMPFPPTLSLVTPTLNQQGTNGVLTATGKASDSAAVASVFCGLNGSAWMMAATTNHWTNWSANLNLIPGTNLIQVYAVDICGNRSATNTARYVYLVFQPLTVAVNGKGTINPNFNGARLAINLNYTMTASASPGFAFTNWMDGAGNLLTNRATLRFTMQTNLTLMANFVDVARPASSISTPTVNQQWTNGTFAATGKASDNLGVGAVYYSLNGAAWTAANTTNNWTNWTAGLVLNPGTNTVRAYAADTSGNISPTNTVKFVYLVRKPMKVSISGRGTVSPNYNQAALAINENYTMTANASTGFAFTNWTDGLGNAVTNRATLQFTMATNLALTANFVDVARPTMSVITPTANQQWTNGTITMTGKAGDNVGVSAVYYSLNGAGLTAAATTNSWTNWTVNLTLTPGTNVIQTWAIDNSGNISATNTVRLVYLVLQPLTVRVVGRGSVNPNYNRTLLAIGRNYTMTASAASGFMLTNWTDGFGNFLTNRATLQFTMATNLTLAANFADVTRPTLSLIAPTLNLRVSNTTYSVTGKASDNVAVGAVFYSLNNSSWTAATTGNNWTNWASVVMLKPGTNNIRVCAMDTSGNSSPTNSGTVNLIVPPAASATLVPVAYGDGAYAFIVSGATGYKYLVQASSDLANWVPLQTNIAPFTFLDTNASQFDQRFYRTIFNP